jgi:hypothetical protein
MELIISNLLSKKDNGCVLQVEWAAILRENAYIAMVNGKIDLNEKTPADADFVPFEDLTENIVLGWLEPILDKQKIKSDLDFKMQEIKNSTSVVSGKPW